MMLKAPVGACALLTASSTAVLSMSLVGSVSGTAVVLAKLGLLTGGAWAVALLASVRAFGAERAARFWATSLVLVAAVVCAAILGEFLVRLALKDITTTGDNGSYFARTWHREHVRLNSWAFREREFELPKPTGTFRIAVIGDSITYGQGIPETERFTNLVEKDLAGYSANFEVLNFGRPGAETIDELRTLGEVLERAHPDFVLLQWFVNDVEGRDKGGRPSLLPLLPSPILVNALHRRSALYYLVDAQWKSQQRAVQHLIGDGYTYVDYMEQRFSPRQGAQFESYLETLKQFVVLCRKSQVPVGIVVFPMMTDSGFALDSIGEMVIEFCTQESLTCVDLHESFAPHVKNRGLWVNRFDNHPNSFANRLAAERIMATYGEDWLSRSRNGRDS